MCICCLSLLIFLATGRLDGFFKVLPKTEEQVATLKRKNAERLEEKRKMQKQETAAKKGAKGKPKGAT